MDIRQRRYSKEELAHRGQALYESRIRHQLDADAEGKIVAVDVDSGAFEIANHVLPATHQLFERYPDAQPWVVRVGHQSVYHFGSQHLANHSNHS